MVQCMQEHHTPVASGMVGGFLIGLIGIFLPPTMFWGEFEIRTLANPTKAALPHIWPKGGFYGLDMFMQVRLLSIQPVLTLSQQTIFKPVFWLFMDQFNEFFMFL